ncbi:MAG TPA: cytochrome c oxidase subunit II [Verrucomicrobiae bacterium]|nr:cytochrome c oxidase subunit II [Verrucomicrobiae bacterium]
MNLPTVPFSPVQASTLAGQVDLLYLYLIAVSVFFTCVIFATVLFFTLKYKRRSETERPEAIHGNLLLEITWSAIPLAIAMTMFTWGSILYFKGWRAPQNAEEIFVVGKQWMWKIQHPEGRREINELHVPVDHPIRLKMTSEDVIHSFFVPAFRVKMDVVPGRYTSLWFQPTKTGRYHLFCAEYCGTKHSGMIGWVTVMPEEEYQQWLETGTAIAPVTVSGKELFQKNRCNTCHHAESGALGPDLAGVFGNPVQLADGRTVTADENYIRESIVKPNAKIVAGYTPMMPTFQGQLGEEEILQIISYLKSLKAETGTPETAAPPASPAA